MKFEVIYKFFLVWGLALSLLFVVASGISIWLGLSHRTLRPLVSRNGLICRRKVARLKSVFLKPSSIIFSFPPKPAFSTRSHIGRERSVVLLLYFLNPPFPHLECEHHAQSRPKCSLHFHLTCCQVDNLLSPIQVRLHRLAYRPTRSVL